MDCDASFLSRPPARPGISLIATTPSPPFACDACCRVSSDAAPQGDLRKNVRKFSWTAITGGHPSFVRFIPDLEWAGPQCSLPPGAPRDYAGEIAQVFAKQDIPAVFNGQGVRLGRLREGQAPGMTFCSKDASLRLSMVVIPTAKILSLESEHERIEAETAGSPLSQSRR